MAICTIVSSLAGTAAARVDQLGSLRAFLFHLLFHFSSYSPLFSYSLKSIHKAGAIATILLVWLPLPLSHLMGYLDNPAHSNCQPPLTDLERSSKHSVRCRLCRNGRISSRDYKAVCVRGSHTLPQSIPPPRVVNSSFHDFQLHPRKPCWPSPFAHLSVDSSLYRLSASMVFQLPRKPSRTSDRQQTA